MAVENVEIMQMWNLCKCGTDANVEVMQIFQIWNSCKCGTHANVPNVELMQMWNSCKCGTHANVENANVQMWNWRKYETPLMWDKNKRKQGNRKIKIREEVMWKNW